MTDEKIGPTVDPIGLDRGDYADQQTHENEEVQLDKDTGERVWEGARARKPDPIFIEQGISSLDIDFPLACKHYPNPELIPDPGEFELHIWIYRV